MALKKMIFYSSFVALGVFWAEVVSSNVLSGLLNPFLYLAYGLLYVIFIDALIRYEVKRFFVWYLFGALVGLITETYVAKVTFYGADLEAVRFLGVAPGATLFIMLFYHAFFSFLAPAYFAVRIFGMPLPLVLSRKYDIALFAAPLIILPVLVNTVAQRALIVGGLTQQMMLSIIILVFWVILLSKQGAIPDIRLTNKERRLVYGLTFFFYLVFLFTCTNFHHGHTAGEFPLWPMILVSLFIFFILWGLKRLLWCEVSTQRTQKRYESGQIRWKLFFIWIFWYFSISIGAVFWGKPSNTGMRLWLLLLGVMGSGLGLFTFMYSIFQLIKHNILISAKGKF